MREKETHFESLGKGPGGEDLRLLVSPSHKFGTDAFLLAAFAGARHKDKAVDLGSGCGIIPFILYKKYNPSVVYGVEIQEDGFLQFKTSVEQSGVTEKILPVHGDLRELKGLLPAGGFDLVTCNPPYNLPGSGLVSGIEARRLARHEFSCDIGDVCQAAARLLKFGGRLCLCQRPARLADVICAMRESGLEPKRLRFAAKNPETPPFLFLIEGQRGAKPFLRAEPTLTIMNPDGSFTDEMLAVYGNL